MSTRSRIARQLPDGSIRVIYCHSDGYLSYNGEMLLHHYEDAAKVDALLDLGDISSLNEEIGEKHDFDDYRVASENNWVRAYGRDRGEDNIAAQVYPSLDAFPADHCEEFFYLHTADGWKWFPGQKKSALKPLTQADIDGSEA